MGMENESEKYRKAFFYIREKEPEIRSLCEEFNDENDRKLSAKFSVNQGSHMGLLSVKKSEGQLLVNEDEVVAGELASLIDKAFNSHVRRILSNPKKPFEEIRYTVEPKLKMIE